MTDYDLFEGLKTGERAAILRIYETLLPTVDVWVRDNNGSKEDALDIFQETLETILLKIDSVKSSFGGLVIAIAKKKWIDKLRKKATATKSEEALKELVSDLSQDYAKSELEYQKFKLMERHFIRLSETCQKIMTMIKAGSSVSEIVGNLSLSSPNTLYRRKAACIQRWSELVKSDPYYKEVVA